MRYLILPIVLVAALLAAVLYTPDAHQRVPSAAQAELADPAVAPVAPSERALAATVDATRWRLTYRQSVQVNGEPRAEVHVAGEWHVIPRSGRTEVRFEARTVDGPTLPHADELQAPFELVHSEGALRDLGFARDTPDAARNLLTALVTTFQYSHETTAEWTVEEPSMQGARTARYTRRGDTVTRLVDGEAGETRFHFDADGLQRVDVDVRAAQILGVTGDQQIELAHALKATLERVDVQTRTLRAPAMLPLVGVRGHLDPVVARRDRMAERLAGATRADLRAELDRVNTLDRQHPDTQRYRSVLLKQQVAMLRLQPASAAHFGDLLRAHQDSPGHVSLLAGSLSSAGTPEATAALTELLHDDLDPSARDAVITSLATTRAPSVESAEALSAAYTDGEDHAGLALGAQARALAETEPAAAEDAVATLLDAYAQAPTPAARRTALLALANTGDRRAFPVMVEAIGTGLGEEAVFGLRFIPGQDVDQLLAAFVDGDGAHLIPAANAAAWRADPSFWRPRLAAALDRHADNERYRLALESALSAYPG